ncbi:MFS transporter [Actinorugispora endophytica]|uniref:Putative MFS family arabinose efflux permease n=1 Tax=Actinorugispora endophytica TaxID=1605990 RepID=A0A4V3D7Q2_9ACTN|nr:MFS transporter [Actinorugispora endophytica]TDQ48757.1 putative MFS family arabinose efflux permease [Actinorugispora endophytica]
MLKSYRPLFSIPHLPNLFVWSLAARLQVAGLPIGVTFLVADWTGSYALAGVVTATLTVGTAVAGPLRGRMADRGRVDRLVAVCGLVYSAGLLALALLPGSLWWAAVPLTLVTGLFMPPANQVGRALWPRLTSGPDRTTMYAAEATFQELLFVVGPLMAAAAVGWGGGRAAVLLMGATSLVGALGFAAAIRRAGVAAAPVPTGGGRAARGRRSLLLRPELTVLIAVCTLLVGGLAAVDLVIVAWARELGSPGHAGGLAAVWALGSLVGGLVAGGLHGTPRIPRRAFSAAFGTALLIPLLPPLTELPTPWLLSPVLFAAGLAIAPTLAAVTERLGDAAPEDRRAEAFGWMSTGITTGVALSAPLTGWLVDAGGVASAVAGGAVLILAAAVLTLRVPQPGPHGTLGTVRAA